MKRLRDMLKIMQLLSSGGEIHTWKSESESLLLTIMDGWTGGWMDGWVDGWMLILLSNL